MIPWFVVDIIAAIALLFGHETYVVATCGGSRWGPDRISFRRVALGDARPRRLRARGVGAFVVADEVDAYPDPAVSGVAS